MSCILYKRFHMRELVKADVERCVRAGTDNTMYTQCKALVYLHQYPEWLTKMQDEQDRLRSEHGDEMTRHVRPLPPLQCTQT